MPKVADFNLIPTYIWRPRWGDPVRISSRSLATEKLESVGYRYTLFAPEFSLFDTIPECYRHTHTQTYADSI